MTTDPRPAPPAVLLCAMACLLAAMACSSSDDDFQPSDGNGGGQGQGGDQGGGAGDGGAQDGGAGDGAGEGEGEGEERSGCDPPEDTCPDLSGLAWPESRTGAAGPVAVRVIIEAVDFDNDRIALRNISDRPIALDGWDVVLESFAHPALPEGQVLLPGARLVIATVGDGQDDECQVWSGQSANAYDLKPEVGELAVRADTTAVAALDNLEAYVRWGADPPDPGTRLRDEAAAAGLWVDSLGEFVATSPDTLGIVATGDVATPGGWMAPDGACFGIAP